MSGTNPKVQVRPRLRSRIGVKPKSANAVTLLEDDVEQTRQRIENWMGLRSTNDDAEVSQEGSYNECDYDSSSPESQHDEKEESSSVAITSHSKHAKSILKTPKYTMRPLAEKQSTQDTVVEPEASSLSWNLTQANPRTDQSEEVTSDSPTIICKDLVVERDPTKPMLKRKVHPHAPNLHSHSAVEGYVPFSASPSAATLPESTTPSPNLDASDYSRNPEVAPNKDASMSEIDDSAPLILNSLEELFQAAGKQLPQHEPSKITPDTKLLEADIAFSVMTQEAYNGKLAALKEQHEEERQAQLKVFVGMDDIFDDDGSSKDGDTSDEDDLLDVLMGDGQKNEDDYFDDYGNEDEVECAPRPFRLLWETLSQWITPEAVQYITHLTTTSNDDASDEQWRSPIIERTDVEASRCAGLMAMVKLYLPRSLEELHFAQELRRTADNRLGELLRMFNYVEEAPKLPVKLWKAMTCILLEIVLVEQRRSGYDGMVLPPSIASIEMTIDEYRYLSKSAVKSFGVP